MWGASRWTARFLMLVMLVPAFGPMVMPCAAAPVANHCLRQPISGNSSANAPGNASAPAARRSMSCHHAMAQSETPRPASSSAPTFDTSFRSADGDCCHSRCCCGATTSEWAQPASPLLSFVDLSVESARPSPGAVLHSSDVARQDSARAPPLS
jgi:hypothetical protein